MSSSFRVFRPISASLPSSEFQFQDVCRIRPQTSGCIPIKEKPEGQDETDIGIEPEEGFLDGDGVCNLPSGRFAPRHHFIRLSGSRAFFATTPGVISVTKPRRGRRPLQNRLQGSNSAPSPGAPDSIAFPIPLRQQPTPAWQLVSFSSGTGMSFAHRRVMPLT